MSGPVHAEGRTSIPDLRIVLTEHVIPHEHHDGQRLDPLVERISADDTLMNPPIVAELSNGKYVVLDGANRVTALGMLSIPHCLVQVVPYKLPYVELYTWHHAVTDINPSILDARITEIKGIQIEEVDLISAQAQLVRRVLICYYVCADGRVVALKSQGDLRERTRVLNEVVSIYLHNGRLHRTNAKDFGELSTLFHNLSALVVFPSYEPVEILELAEGGEKIPPGLTRHIIHGRAMRVHYPLDVLRANDSLQRKNEVLAGWVQKKLADKEVRYYAESTFLFDD